MKTFEEYLNKMGYSWNDFDHAHETENLIEQYVDEKVKQALKVSNVVERDVQLKTEDLKKQHDFLENEYSNVMENFKKQYRDLEQRVFFELGEKVQASKDDSKHIDGKALKIDVLGYTELVMVNDRLTFLDEDGLHYSVWADCNLEDLIDILNSF